MDISIASADADPNIDVQVEGFSVTFPRVETVSVVISSYNGEQYISESIESAISQTVPPYEIVVVDDGSCDRSVDIAKGYAGVTLFRQENSGRFSARNKGLANTVGDAVIFLDQDDRLLPNNIEIGMNVLNGTRKAGFSAGFSILIDQYGNRVEPARKLGTPPPCTYARMLEGHIFVPPSCVMFRREVLEDVGGWDDKFTLAAEDDDILLRVASRYAVKSHDETIVEYRRHSENGSGSAFNLVSASIQLYRKHRVLTEHDPTLLASLEAGRCHKLKLFGDGLIYEAVRNIRQGDLGRALRIIVLAIRWHPLAFSTYMLSKVPRMLRF